MIKFYVYIWFLILYVSIIQNSITENRLYQMKYLNRISEDELIFLLEKYKSISNLNKVYFSFCNFIFILYLFCINKLTILFIILIILIIKFIYESIKYYKNTETNFIIDFKKLINFTDYFYCDFIFRRVTTNRSILVFILHMIALFTYIAIII